MSNKIKTFKYFSKKGYKHYTENTIEELDKLPLSNHHIITEFTHLREWLRVNHGIWVTVFTNKSENWKTLFSFRLDWIYPEDTPDLEDIEPKYYKILDFIKNEYSSPQEAYSAAFHYIQQNNLI